MVSVKLRIEIKSFACFALAATLAVTAVQAQATAPVATVRPKLETPALFDDEAGGEADADDPSIWLHPVAPAKSVMVGTKKNAGLSVYDLAGQELQAVAAPPPPTPDDAPGRFNNVDVVYGFTLGGRSVDLAVTTDRGRDKLRIYTIDPAKAAQSQAPLVDVTDPDAGFVFSADQVQVNEQTTAYGLALYRNRHSGRTFAFVSQRSRTAIAKLELFDIGGGQVGYRKIAEVVLPESFTLPNGTSWTPCNDPGDLAQVEGMVVDQELGILYAGQEDVGIWRISAAFEAASPVLVDKVREFGVPYTYDTEEEECVIDYAADPGYGGKHLSADVEGLTIYYTASNQGYLIASSQGDNTFAVYDRRDVNRFIGGFEIADNRRKGVDGVQECDGAAVLNVPLGAAFPLGLLVTQDGGNTPEVSDNEGEARDNTNFKYTPWQSLAKAFPSPLAIDTTSWNPRTGYGL
ncbi:phytase [Gloeobacter violaceus]|nr:phytase [Gloeobacter violaceus]